MIVRFRKLSDERHALEILRSGQVLERRECETRSLLVHDLLHFAIECEAKIADGFWGTLASGKTLAELDASLLPVERLVGPATSLAKGESPRHVFAQLVAGAEASGEPLPEWLSETFLVRVEERLRQLLGRWRATRFGERLELVWH